MLVGSVQEMQTTTNAKVERHGNGRTSRSSTNTERIEAIDDSKMTSKLCVAKGEANGMLHDKDGKQLKHTIEEEPRRTYCTTDSVNCSTRRLV